MSEAEIIQAIEMAIANEMDARRIYLELSEQAEDPELKRILHEIAQEEASHEASLRSRLRLYKDRHFLRQTMSRYVSPILCEEILKNPQLLHLGGRRQRVTVLFADIWGFTSLAEQETPEKIVEILNHFFTAMVDIIFEHEGTLDKFIGDNLMALFGTPVAIEAPAVKAARCALAMQRRLAEMQQEGCRIQRLGIGINTGEVIVGNIGSPPPYGFHRHRRCGQHRFAPGGFDPGTGCEHPGGAGDLQGDCPLFSFGSSSLGGARGRQQPLEAYALLGEKEPPDLKD